MELKQELEEIKSKDLSNMTEEELKDYKTFLLDYHKDAEKKSKSKLWKNVFNIGGGTCSICAGVLMLVGVFSISRTLSIGLMLLCYGIATVLLIATKIFKNVSKKADQNCENIKRICNEKISEADREISVWEFRRKLQAEKEAEIRL